MDPIATKVKTHPKPADRFNMYRWIFGLTVMVCFGLYVRHEFNNVIQQITKPRTENVAAAHRRKCLMCGGTGQRASLGLGMNGTTTRYETCRSCNGKGWVEYPAFTSAGP
jgi:hypothetical protein